MGLRRPAALALTVLLVPLAACGDDEEPIDLVEGVTVEVSAVDNSFRPETIQIAAGTEVLWTNDGRTEHNVVPADDGDDFGVDPADFAPGDEYSFRFTEPGTYAYYCSLHGSATVGMTGTVEVTEGEVDATSTTAAGSDTTEAAGEGEILRVPEDHDTIQAAVDAAAPGDMVLVGPGVYEEAVDVETDGITIRGTDRNEVILDGGFELDNGIRVLGADGVVVENMTARNYATNGFFWTEVDGYRGSHLTAYRNGDYGIYAFDSVNGQFNDSYASGSPDAGFYIGQCYPCNAVISNVVSEYNGLGYSGTNAGGDLYIVNSVFRFNRAGIVPNSGSYELCYPERESTLAGNVVYSNNQADSPAIEVALLAMGNGILIAGGHRNLIVNNLVEDHERTGIGLAPFPEEGASDDIPTGDELDLPCAEARELPLADPADIPELLLWNSQDNEVRGNVVRGSGMADLAFGALDATDGLGNCFSDNDFATSAPLTIEALAPCEGTPTATDWTAGALDLAALIAAERPPPGDYRVQPIPPAQPGMDDPEGAPFAPFTGPDPIDVDAIAVPAGRPED
jgi:plastocyanin